MSPLQSAKIALVEATSLGKDALHVYVGLAVMLSVAAALKKPLSDWRPILAVALAALAGEIWDIFDTFSLNERPRWSRNVKDIWNTLFWATALFMLARFTRVLKR
jgi:hypothetical protein